MLAAYRFKSCIANRFIFNNLRDFIPFQNIRCGQISSRCYFIATTGRINGVIINLMAKAIEYLYGIMDYYQ